MPEWLDVSAILWSLALAVLISAIGGAIMGGTLAAKDEAENPGSEDEFIFDDHPGAWQIVFALSIFASMASGALLGHLASDAPYQNSATLAVIILILHVVLRDREMPAWLYRSSIVVMPLSVFVGTYLIS